MPNKHTCHLSPAERFAIRQQVRIEYAARDGFTFVGGSTVECRLCGQRYQLRSGAAHMAHKTAHTLAESYADLRLADALKAYREAHNG